MSAPVGGLLMSSVSHVGPRFLQPQPCFKAILHQCHVNIWSERMPGTLLPHSCFHVLPLHPCTLLLHFVSSDILENALSYLSPSSHLKTLQRGDRNYQSAVHKFPSSSRNTLRSSFYILLLPRRHKSPGSAQRHLLHSPPPRKPSPASPVSSPLSGFCLFWTFFIFFHSDLMPSL